MTIEEIFNGERWRTTTSPIPSTVESIDDWFTENGWSEMASTDQVELFVRPRKHEADLGPCGVVCMPGSVLFWFTHTGDAINHYAKWSTAVRNG